MIGSQLNLPHLGLVTWSPQRRKREVLPACLPRVPGACSAWAALAMAHTPCKLSLPVCEGNNDASLGFLRELASPRSTGHGEGLAQSSWLFFQKPLCRVEQGVHSPNPLLFDRLSP